MWAYRNINAKDTPMKRSRIARLFGRTSSTETEADLIETISLDAPFESATAPSAAPVDEFVVTDTPRSPGDLVANSIAGFTARTSEPMPVPMDSFGEEGWQSFHGIKIKMLRNDMVLVKLKNGDTPFGIDRKHMVHLARSGLVRLVADQFKPTMPLGQDFLMKRVDAQVRHGKKVTTFFQTVEQEGRATNMAWLTLRHEQVIEHFDDLLIVWGGGRMAMITPKTFRHGRDPKILSPGATWQEVLATWQSVQIRWLSTELVQRLFSKKALEMLGLWDKATMESQLLLREEQQPATLEGPEQRVALPAPQTTTAKADENAAPDVIELGNGQEGDPCDSWEAMFQPGIPMQPLVLTEEEMVDDDLDGPNIFKFPEPERPKTHKVFVVRTMTARQLQRKLAIVKAGMDARSAKEAQADTPLPRVLKRSDVAAE